MNSFDPSTREIPYSRVVLDSGELEQLQQVLESGWLTTARKTHLFEERFASEVGAKHAYAVNSCTAALHLALEALGVGPGDKVFVPTMTFTATAEVVRYLGADPIFLDVQYGTCLVTPEILAEGIAAHPEAKVLTIVHYGGQAADMLGEDDELGILALCRNHGIRVVEDAAHAFPTKHKGRMVGSLGDVTCFSFYANKTITTGEGGMLTTNEAKIAERVRVMRLHGIDRDVWSRHTSTNTSWEYDVIAPGYKYNMPDVNAAIGLAQLAQAHRYRAERERCAMYYFRSLEHINTLDMPVVNCAISDHAWHLFPVIIKESAAISRQEFIETMSSKGIGTSVHYKPLHRMSYYRERYGLRAEDYPGAEGVWRGCVSLPIYPSLSDDELERICTTICVAMGQH